MTSIEDTNILICGETCLRARGINRQPCKAVPCYVGTSGGIEVIKGRSCAYNFLKGQIDSGQQYTPSEQPLLDIALQSQLKCIDKNQKFPFPYINSHSPGYNSHKRGGDNPNPHMRC